ncbi:MAG: GWxTD domain-containing protein [Gemmatimonadales bacterium]
MRLAPALLALSLALPLPGAAQSPGARVALRRWQDTLQREVDTALVIALYARTERSFQSPEERSLLPLRAGLLAIRLGEVTGQPDYYQDALEQFGEAQAAHADWPWAWQGTGLANLGLAGNESSLTNGLRAFVGRSVSERAVEGLVRGASIDPEFVDGIQRVAERAIAFRQLSAGKIALETLRALATQRAGHTPTLLLARARIEREFGTPTLAIQPLEEFLERQPNSAIGLLELARSRFIIGRLDGVESWFAGLGLATDSVLAAYRGDLAPLEADSVLAEFDRGTPASRVALMRRYWADQDPDRLPAIAERMRDHYMRIDYARRNYRLRKLADPKGVDPVVLAMGSEIDARGIVFVKHGPPDESAVSSVIGLPPNESWSYHRADGTELLFHFLMLDGDVDFREYPSLLDVFARSNQFRWFASHGDKAQGADTMPRTLQTYGAELSAQIAQELMLSRWNVSQRYRDILAQGKSKADSLQAAERAVGVKSAAMPGSFALRYELPLAANVQVLAVGHERGGGTVQVVYAVRAGGLIGHQEGAGSTFGYPIRLRVAVVDAKGNFVAGLDTTRVHRSSFVLEPSQQLIGRFPLAVPPGKYTIRVAIESDMHGSITPRQDISVYSREAPTLALSDIVLGAKIGLGWMPSPSDTAWVNPLRTFAAREPMELYFEVSGLASGTSYLTSMAVYRVSGETMVTRRADELVASGGTPALSIGFTQTHPGGVAPVRREIALQRLKPGEYVLQVTVSTTGGPSVVRRQAFVITK